MLLEKGSIQFPEDPEPLFWKRFFRYISYGVPFPESEAVKLLGSYKKKELQDELMLGLLDMRKYGKFCKDLFPPLLNVKTTKNCYIANYYEMFHLFESWPSASSGL